MGRSSELTKNPKTNLSPSKITLKTQLANGVTPTTITKQITFPPEKMVYMDDNNKLRIKYIKFSTGKSPIVKVLNLR